jgi:phosphomannomutase
MKDENAVLGGEMSGHIFFKDKWYGFDDGIYTGARMIEILSNEAISSSELFNKLPQSFFTPEININVYKDGFQHDFMKKFSKKANFPGAKIVKIDGLRADYENGWGLIRASNTTSCLVMRFEAETEEQLIVIKKNFIKEILKIDSTLEIPDG